MIPFKEYLDMLKKKGLGIDRKDMPQIPKEDYQSFVDYVEKQGILIEKRVGLSPKELIPVQQTYKDKDIEELIDITDMSRPILVSKDHYIIDGHHRWLVGLFTKRQKVTVTIINLNIMECLNLAKQFIEQK